MFIQKCFIRKNTEYLRDKLTELGYEHYKNIDEYKCHSTYIVSDNGRTLFYYDGFNNENIINSMSNFIDCKKNEELFLAIAALRDDSDDYQWFIDPCGYWYFNPTSLDGLRKATVDELIFHFTSFVDYVNSTTISSPFVDGKDYLFAYDSPIKNDFEKGAEAGFNQAKEILKIVFKNLANSLIESTSFKGSTKFKEVANKLIDLSIDKIHLNKEKLKKDFHKF